MKVTRDLVMRDEIRFPRYRQLPLSPNHRVNHLPCDIIALTNNNSIIIDSNHEVVPIAVAVHGSSCHSYRAPKGRPSRPPGTSADYH